MKKVITALTVLLGFASAMPTALCAQDPYDDLYYSPSKAAKQKKEQEKKLKEAIEAQTYNYTTIPTADYPAADTYSAGSSKPLNVDVDAYNRRYASTTAAAADTAMQEEFAYTRRIERYVVAPAETPARPPVVGVVIAPRRVPCPGVLIYDVNLYVGTVGSIVVVFYEVGIA